MALTMTAEMDSASALYAPTWHNTKLLYFTRNKSDENMHILYVCKNNTNIQLTAGGHLIFMYSSIGMDIKLRK